MGASLCLCGTGDWLISVSHYLQRRTSCFVWGRSAAAHRGPHSPLAFAAGPPGASAAQSAAASFLCLSEETLLLERHVSRQAHPTVSVSAALPSYEASQPRSLDARVSPSETVCFSDATAQLSALLSPHLWRQPRIPIPPLCCLFNLCGFLSLD